jgi:hypothetical protein
MSGIYTHWQLWQAAMTLAEEIDRITKTFPSQVNLANLTLILNRRSLFSARVGQLLNGLLRAPSAA